ncbi:D-glycero-beta-D-manno-heptose-7-phosphate kinase [Candidatus Woesearchaeota archaeon]|nr:D-glycero-beta-D-manno-heptose-7-phosphate kinase [Candidatus Woesearchaeota archaeon]
MANENLLKILGKFRGKKIMVLGDIMLDKFIWGEVNRISPEAPVQVVAVTKENFVPGGAANVSNNIASLGAGAVMTGIVGNDNAKDELVMELEKKKVDVSGMFVDRERPTIQKVRVIGRSQQLLRFDYEKKGYLDAHIEDQIFAFIESRIDEIDAVIVSDYAKGTVTKGLMENLIELCNSKGKIIVIDPKPQHRDFYRGATLITPNHTEAHQMANFFEENNNNEEIEGMGKKLMEYLGSNVLITRGEKGMSLFEKNGKVTHIPTFAKEVYDIVGAGDTSVATLTLALAAGASFREAAMIANYAAGIVVAKIGTATASIDELKKSIEDG